MPQDELNPMKVQEAVRQGFRRLRNFRRARLMFLRNYTGQYYDSMKGDVGSEPLALIFNAVRVIVPNIVMSFPKHVITTEFMAYRGYAGLLAMAMDTQAKVLNLRDVYRRWIVDSLFTMGILKTGLCDSGRLVSLDVDDQVDPGEVYTELVDFDNYVFDPSTRGVIEKEASFVGDRIRVVRSLVMDSGLYDNAIIEKLPSAGSKHTGERRSSDLTTHGLSPADMDWQDEIDLIELYVPSAKAIITIPDTDAPSKDFLRTDDYYGPDEGPYTYLRLTPPVPGNPMPIAAVGVWNDLHILANRMAAKVADQADRQKDVLVYKRSAADDAEEITGASDGESVAVDSPKEDVQVLSYGGQRSSNEVHLQQLMQWFNLMSGNTEALGGMRENSATATQANILNANQTIGLEDMKDIVHAGVAEESRKRAWYLHTDPLIEVPLIRRSPQRDQATGLTVMTEEQLFLTPEVRRGDFMDYMFDIEPKSMSRMDPQMRLQRAMEFAIKIIPAAAAAAQMCMQMGTMFSFPKFVTLMAKEAGIEWMDEVFYDPEFQMQQLEIMMKLPQLPGSQASTKENGPGSVMPAVRQNGQPGNVAAVPSAGKLEAQGEQAGANAGQADLPVRGLI